MSWRDDKDLIASTHDIRNIREREKGDQGFELQVTNSDGIEIY